MSQRLAFAMAAVVLVIGSASILTEDSPLAIVEVGPAHSISSQWIAGEPVWVVNDGGDVSVLVAVNPHPWWGVDELVGWCESAGGLQAWWDGSRFDIQGRHLYGPAPRDLDRHEVLARKGNSASIGPVTRAPGRSLDADEPDGAWCRMDGQDGPEPRYHRIAGSEREVFTGRIVSTPDGVATFCPGIGEPCPADTLRVAGVLTDGEHETVIAGTFLARRRSGELVDVIYLPGE